MVDDILNEAREKMDKSLHSFQQEIANIRTGRASVGLLDSIEVDVYGTKMKLNQLATINAPEVRLLTIQPWDKSQLGAIEKAIMTSPLEINPSNDGTIIRLPLPQLTEERRKELVKLVSKLAEDAKVSVRSVRRTEMETVKKLQKDGDLPEDDAHKVSSEIQKITDGHTAKIDEIFKHKEAEIMEV